jgi:hypothetical protein
MSGSQSSALRHAGDHARRRRARALDPQWEAGHLEAVGRQRAQIDGPLDLRVGEVCLVGGPEDAGLSRLPCALGLR